MKFTGVYLITPTSASLDSYSDHRVWGGDHTINSPFLNQYKNTFKNIAEGGNFCGIKICITAKKMMTETVPVLSFDSNNAVTKQGLIVQSKFPGWAANNKG